MEPGDSRGFYREPAWLASVRHCNACLEQGPSLVPPDHYFSTFSALANVNAFLKTRNPSFLAFAETHLRAYLAASPKGHAEFNAVALGFLKRKTESDNEVAKLAPLVLECKRLTPALKRAGENVSNNWLVLGLCARRLWNKSDGGDAIRARLKDWQLADGALVDYPLAPRREAFATPLAYHAKMAFWLHWLSRETRDAEMEAMAVSATRFLAAFVGPHGDSFFFGRTTDSLFGYVHARLVLGELRNVDSTIASASDQLNEAWKELRGPDGRLFPVPGMPAVVHGRDFYIFDSVYHAYATALWSEFEDAESAEQKAIAHDRDFFFFGRASGLLSVRKNDGFVAWCLTGQRAPGQSHFFSDSRYFALDLLWLLDANCLVVGPPPLNRRNDYSVFAPENNGFGLAIASGERRGIVRVLEDVDVKQTPAGFLATGRGVVSWFRPPRGVWDLLVWKLKRWASGRTPDVFERDDSVEMEFELETDLVEKRMRVRVKSVGARVPDMRIGFGARAMRTGGVVVPANAQNSPSSRGPGVSWVDFKPVSDQPLEFGFSWA